MVKLTEQKKEKEVTMWPALYDCMPPISEGHKWMQWDAISLYLATTMRLPRSPILIPNFIQMSCL